MESSIYMNLSKAAAALVAALLLGSFVPPAPVVEPPAVEQAELRFEQVPLDEDDPGRPRLGALTYLGGWSITSGNRRFGSISAMHVEAGRVTAVSDAGTVITFPLPAGGRSRARLETLRQGPGRAGDKLARDAESLLIAGDRAWVAFENRNAVWRYARGSWRAEAAARPREMRRWPFNRGSEAIARLADGRFLIMAEAISGDGTSLALLFDGDPALPESSALEFRYRPPAGYKVTDAAVLPDGRVLVLTRRFAILEGFSARLTVLRLPRRLVSGMIVGGEEIARFEPPVTTDNFEALSVGRENGRSILWIASDDNFNPLQRTLLLRFALP